MPRHSPRWVKGAAPISNPSRPRDLTRTKPQRRMSLFLHFSFEVRKILGILTMQILMNHPIVQI